MNQKKNHKLATMLLLSAVIFNSCNSSVTRTELNETDNYSDTSTLNVVENESKEELEINFYLDGKTTFMEGLIEQFKKDHPEVTINTTDYSDLSTLDYRTKLSSELMTGEGPDVLLIINNGNESLNFLPDMQKIIQSGIFLDVNELGIDLSECNQTVMKAGVYEDKQLLLPLYYSLGFLYTTEERLNDAGITYYEGITLEEFASSFPEFYDNNPEKKAFLNYLTGRDFFQRSSFELIDHNNNTIIDSTENITKLEKLVSAYDNLFPDIFSGKAMDYMFYLKKNEYGSTYRHMYQSGDLLFMSGVGFDGSFQSISMYNNYIYPDDQAKGETPIIFPLPTLDGTMPSPTITYSLAVNSNTENEEAVKLFIETSIGMDAQYNSIGGGIPVNNTLIEHMKEFYLTDGYDRNDPYAFPKNCEYAHEFVEAYFNVIENMSEPSPIIDTTITDYFFTIIRNAVLQEKTVEAGVADVKSQIEFYLAE